MKLSEKTVNVLKNYGTISEGMSFKKGNVLRTISKTRNILSQCKVEESFPQDFAIYDVNNFLSVLSLYKDNADITFDDKGLFMTNLSGRSKMQYRFCDPKMIVVPPEKEVTMPSIDVTFSLDKEDLEWIKGVSNVISAPNLAVRSDGKKINVVSYDASNDSSATNELTVGDGNGDSYNFIFKTEAIAKVMTFNYDISISQKGICYFKCKDVDLEYWISTEAGSTFNKKS